ncbi:hypothetical protein FKM82_028695, partial [Ascaphus truei]
KLKEVAFPKAEELKKELSKRYCKEYAEYKEKKKCEEEDAIRCLTLQHQLETEKQRVALMRQQQEQQEQFQVFEEMMRRKEREAERLQILHEFGKDTSSQLPGGPLIPGVNEPPATLQAHTNDPAPPAVDRTLKPASIGHHEGNVSSDGLRHMSVPRDVCCKFLQLAESNTQRGVETCGILCGKL